MSSAPVGSTLPRRMLGRALKRLRDNSGVPPKVAAQAIRISPQTLWRIETGQQGPKLKEIYVQTLCKLYGAAVDETKVLVGLVPLCDQQSWVHLYEDVIPEVFALYVALEEEARVLTTHQLNLMPGLVQTADYRREGVWALQPQASPTEVQRNVELTMRRQQRIHNDPDNFTFNVLLCESVLRYPVGGPAVMGRQCRHLLELSHLPNVSIRVVPISKGMHVGLQVGPFSLLEFPEHPAAYLSEPPVIYIDGHTGALYLERETEIRQYHGALTGIRRVALDDAETRVRIAQIAREYEE
ncbi:helix-turn-helix domain-containing protein [Nocardia terpenica]|uniref:Helix-turn-helix domain-containing protein n=1 Tax=Nocardia terpenica TaxID=455432 RepID=A0A6G9Z7M9_9NOCA|nr:helix-turn-helix transcriptional regulator [Nocardia terpenica]QIS21528.1 helix-turn-helix domain-containing protein [Nocardia terpenica]